MNCNSSCIFNNVQQVDQKDCQWRLILLFIAVMQLYSANHEYALQIQVASLQKEYCPILRCGKLYFNECSCSELLEYCKNILLQSRSRCQNKCWRMRHELEYLVLVEVQVPVLVPEFSHENKLLECSVLVHAPNWSGGECTTTGRILRMLNCDTAPIVSCYNDLPKTCIG